MLNYDKKETDKYGTIRYFLNGKLHRNDGPAIEWAYVSKEWWINGQRHRIDGPAIEWDDGYKEWYINGTYYSRSEYYHKLKLLNCPEYFSQ